MTRKASALHGMQPRTPHVSVHGAFLHLALTAVLLFAVVSCGGGEGKKTPADAAVDTTRSVRGMDVGSGTVVDSLQADMTGDGITEAILLSLSDSLMQDPLLQASFDRVDIYDSSQRPPLRLFFDVIEDGRRAETGDVTGDGFSDLIVETDAGGNNPITSRGMHLYGRDADGAVTLLFFISSGAPELRDLNGDGVSEVLVSDQFWGMMAHSEVIVFTRDVYAFDGRAYAHANKAFSAYFERHLSEHMRRFEKEKTLPHLGDESRLRLYRSAAELLAWSFARGGAARAARLWRSERQYLREELFEEQYDDLSAFVDEVRAMERSRQNGRVS